MTDPGFPRGGAPTLKGGGGEEGANLLFDQFFLENCMKMKKFWPGRAQVLGTPLRSVTADVSLNNLIVPFPRPHVDEVRKEPT